MQVYDSSSTCIHSIIEVSTITIIFIHVNHFPHNYFSELSTTFITLLTTLTTIYFSHRAGTNIQVQIEEFSSEGKKLVLSMAFENRASVGALSGMSSSKWLNGVVQSVSNFGIFVRPAGYEMTGKFYTNSVLSTPLTYINLSDVTYVTSNMYIIFDSFFWFH